MRNWSSILLDIEKSFSLEYFNYSNSSDLFDGQAGDFIKKNLLNSSSDKEDYLEGLNRTIYNVTQLMEEMGYDKILDKNLW
jgi:hypothetical protein